MFGKEVLMEDNVVEDNDMRILGHNNVSRSKDPHP